jgi:hypothetical protein
MPANMALVAQKARGGGPWRWVHGNAWAVSYLTAAHWTNHNHFLYSPGVLRHNGMRVYPCAALE